MAGIVKELPVPLDIADELTDIQELLSLAWPVGAAAIGKGSGQSYGGVRLRFRVRRFRRCATGTLAAAVVTAGDGGCVGNWLVDASETDSDARASVRSFNRAESGIWVDREGGQASIPLGILDARGWNSAIRCLNGDRTILG